MRVLATPPVAPPRSLSPRRLVRARRGFALEAALIVLVLVGALVGLTALWVSTVTRTSGLDYRSTRVQAAAEAGADAIMAQLEAAMVDGHLTDTEIDDLTLPTLAGFTFEAMDVARTGGATMQPITKEPFKGLYALNQPIEMRIAARDPRANRAEVVLSVNAQSIPLFQFGVFYEGDLEIHNGPRMEFAGWVHTNGSLYLSSDNTYFQSRLTTPDSVFWRRKDATDRLNGVYINNDAGTQVRLNFDSRSPTRDDAHFREQSEAKFNSRLMTKAHGVDTLRLPLSQGVPPIEMIRPRNPITDGAPEMHVKFAWKADWHIEFNLNSMGTMCQSGGAVASSLRPAGKTTPSLGTSGDCAKIFKWTPNAFREGREDIGVDVLDVDVGALRSWVGTNAGRRTEILYITFRGTGSPANQGDFPVVRLRNAARLPNPITIATSHPLYVWGNFNTNTWQPAALLGDAITMLSPSFADGNHPAGSNPHLPGSYTKRTASNMSVFAAIAAGHSATPCDKFRSGCPGGNYGGGLENFPRFVENWSGKTLTYRGSLVSLFESARTTKRWQWRAYYDAPNRDWEFDVRFQDPTKLPPGTPAVGNVYQTAFRPVY